MINVTIEGTVKRKIELLNMKTAGDKYFTMYLCDDDNNQIRLIAYKNAETELHSKFECGKYYSIKQVAIKDHTYNGKAGLQVTLPKNLLFSEIQRDKETVYQGISNIKAEKGTFVNVIGRAVSYYETPRIMKNGTEKSVLILTIMDDKNMIDLTLWNTCHAEMIKAINEEELTSFIIAIQGASVNVYQGAVTLNVSLDAIIK